MREYFAADCETDPFEYKRVPQPFIWGIYNDRLYEEFTDTQSFVRFVIDKPWVIYAHNGGKFDWHFLFGWLDEFTPITVINGRIAKFKIGECEFRDSFNILPVALSKYKKDDIDYTIFEKDERAKPHNWKKITHYLYTDCKYLFEFIHAYIQEMGMNLTLAGGALKQWTKIYGDSPPQTNESFYDDFARYYYGGRVQCFKTGLIDYTFKVIDINSAYPYAMMFQHPYGTFQEINERLPDNEQEIQRSFITLEADATGVFPFREGQTLTFPADNQPRYFHITGWEYLAARETNMLKNAKIISCTTLEDTISFGPYVDHWFERKAQAKAANDTANYWIAKFHLTTLYGKYGANPRNYEEFINVHPSNIVAAGEVDGYDYCDSKGGFAIMCRPLPEQKHHYYNVAVAASITGFVRAYLWKAICKCHGVMYCDTDSIACEDSGSLILGKQLGEWDVEAQCISGGIAGKKLYAFNTGDGYKTANKGVRLSADQILRVCQGETVTYRADAPTFSVKSKTRFLKRNVAMTT